MVDDGRTVRRAMLRGLVGLAVVVAVMKWGRARAGVAPVVRADAGTGMGTGAGAGASAVSGGEFAVRLFGALEGPDVFVSPVSVATALSMVRAGVEGDIAVGRELDSVLGKCVRTEGAGGGGGGGDVEWVAANSAWVTGGVKAEYVADVQENFGSLVADLPTDVGVINAWVREKTRGMIDSILDRIPPNTVAILVNAVFFKAAWTTSFDPKNTRDAPFYAATGELPARMMVLRGERFPYAKVPLGVAEGPGVAVAQLPYGSEERFAATIVLPDDGFGIDKLVEHLKEGGVSVWDKWIAACVSTKLDVLSIPRFKLTYGATSLKSALQALGMRAAFVPDVDGLFLRMSDDKGVYLGDVIHKAVVEVTEEGTVASAATAAIVLTRSLPVKPPPVFVANRPFLFAITNRTDGSILFIGRVDNPITP